MTAPRQVVAGRTLMLTRRCAHRHFLLRPDSVTNQTFVYCLAVAAERFGILVHAVLVMSNHYHLVITDVHGNYPAFLRYLNSLLARSLNTHRGRWENFWAAEQPSVVHLADTAAILDKTAYTLTNPVAAHLVTRAAIWPGVSSLAAFLDDGRMHAWRPRQFFDKNGEMPERAELRITPPPSFGKTSSTRWRKLVQAEVQRIEQEAESERARTGRRVLGRKAILRQQPLGSPKDLEPRRQMTPRVATRNKWLRIERLQSDKRFRELYRLAYQEWRVGNDARFPWGTYKLRLEARVACDAAPNPAC